jgi:hypothetical protein
LLEKQPIFKEENLSILKNQLKILTKKINFFHLICKKVKNDLRSFNIIHRDKNGINVIVGFKDQKEKESIINYCGSNGYEFTECPRYIRVNADAISIEIKRLKLKD